ncbi:hypothetical protein [Azospirillum agricola]|uniref:hypothetical protein n=1 Tax=Azospirillum agricola TaxID=1720247 RepID=UPI000A0F2F9B|nr:hypothetical protein [Azospirillum agricola]SMH52188.1 hypothetical protein SAMN02982994_3049 [Azospirillum lipoferum]
MALRAVAPPSLRSWGVFGLSANQTVGLAVDSPVRFDTVTSGTLELAGYAILLPAGRVFRLMASTAFNFSAGDGTARTLWFHTAGGFAVGTGSRHIPGTSGVFMAEQPVSHAIVDTRTGAVPVQLRISQATSASAVAAAFTFAEVMEIGLSG